MRVLLVHNRYQIAGGEDSVVAQELAMLNASGMNVELFEVNNDSITSPFARIVTAAQVAYSWNMRARINRVLTKMRPEIVHVHNFFPQISPSVYDAAADAGCSVVQTLHNYRLLCPSATLYRQGSICHECLEKKTPWPGVLHACYRSSRIGTASVAAMIAWNRFRGTWANKVHRYIVLTEFAKTLFTQYSDIPERKLCIKQNAIADPGLGSGRGAYALYVGRLSPEKGISVLLEAASMGLGLPLKVAGAGPLEGLAREAHAAGHIEYLGRLDAEAIRSLMQEAAVLLVPSLWYEGLPMVIPEAFGTGLPVIASKIGSLASLISDGYNGLLVPPADAEAIRAAILRIAVSSELQASLRRGARLTYDARYEPQQNVVSLQQIYQQALDERCQANLNSKTRSDCQIVQP